MFSKLWKSSQKLTLRPPPLPMSPPLTAQQIIQMQQAMQRVAMTQAQAMQQAILQQAATYGSSLGANQYGSIHALTGVNPQGDDMASRQFFLNVRVNFNDEQREQKEELIRALMARTANVIMAHAMLLSDRGSPRVQLYEHTSTDPSIDTDISKYAVEGECPSCGHKLE